MVDGDNGVLFLGDSDFLRCVTVSPVNLALGWNGLTGAEGGGAGSKCCMLRGGGLWRRNRVGERVCTLESRFCGSDELTATSSHCEL